MAKVRTSFALSQTALDALKKLAEADKRSQASMIEVLIEQAVEAAKAKRPLINITLYRELKDKYVGAEGTPERIAFDNEVADGLRDLPK